MKFTLKDIEDNLRKEWNDKLYPEKNQDGDYLFSTKRKFIDFAYDIIDLFDSFPEEFPIYRSIKVKSIEDIDMDYLGESWSFDLESARNFGFQNGSNIILSAIINSNNVNWEESLKRYLIFSPGDFDDENEIVVNNTNKLKNITINKIKEAKEIDKNPIFTRTPHIKDFEYPFQKIQNFESFIIKRK